MPRRPATHNLIHLLLAASGVAMLSVALLDLMIHPLTLWLSLP